VGFIAFQRVIVSPTELKKYNEDKDFNLMELIVKRFRQLIDIDIKNILDCIDQEIKVG